MGVQGGNLSITRMTQGRADIALRARSLILSARVAVPRPQARLPLLIGIRALNVPFIVPQRGCDAVGRVSVPRQAKRRLRATVQCWLLHPLHARARLASSRVTPCAGSVWQLQRLR